MVKSPSRRDDIGNEPAPIFASPAEIAVAEALRLRLEKRYFGSSDHHASPLPTLEVDVH